jgi:hypothetical protein
MWSDKHSKKEYIDVILIMTVIKVILMWFDKDSDKDLLMWFDEDSDKYCTDVVWWRQ